MARKRYNSHHHRRQSSHKKHSRHHRSNLKKLNYHSRKHPIVSGVILIIASLILSRLSFTNSFLNQPEVMMWSLIISGGLFLAGLLVLVAWWRNHVAILNIKHNVNWRNH